MINYVSGTIFHFKIYAISVPFKKFCVHIYISPEKKRKEKMALISKIFVPKIVRYKGDSKMERIQ